MDINKAAEILQLNGQKLTPENIRKAYLRLSKVYHPDANGNNDDYMFKQLGQAYELLMKNADISTSINGIPPEAIKLQLDQLVVDIIDLLGEEIYMKSIIPSVQTWFQTNAPLSQLNNDITYKVNKIKPTLIYKIEQRFDKFSKNLDSKLAGSFSDTAKSIDTKTISNELSEKLTGILGLISASIIAIISGGSGTALIATGPIGIILGAGLGLYLFSKGKDNIKKEVNSFIMNKNLPVFVKGLAKDKVINDLIIGESEFRNKIKTQLEKDLEPIYKQIKLIN